MGRHRSRRRSLQLAIAIALVYSIVAAAFFATGYLAGRLLL